MAVRTIVAIPGDDIGAVVLPEALRVLDAAGFEARYVPAEMGWGCWCRQGEALPERTVELLRTHGIGLFGAVTSKGEREAMAELAPHLRGTGRRYTSPIVRLRQRLGLDVSIRPCRTFPGHPLNFVRRDGRGTLQEPLIDVVVFRQNTEGLYAGLEWSPVSDSLRAALAEHPAMAPWLDTPPDDLAVSVRLATRRACRRIAEAAFSHAAARDLPAVTLCDKPSVLRATGGLLREEAREVAARYPGVALREANIDAQVMWLARDPETHGVVLASNFLGDILSDGYAGLTGGLGLAPSANLGEGCALFEPTHGSAPRYSGRDPSIVNPIAMIRSAAMMLQHLGETDRAARIEASVARVIAEGRVRTFDMLGLDGAADVIGQGAASTSAMTDAIIAALAG